MSSWLRVREYWSDVLFVCGEYIFLGVSLSGVCQSAEDVNPGFIFGDHVACVSTEGQAKVHSQT